jgi:hypothetical protein
LVIGRGRGEGGEGRRGIPSPTMPSNARDTDIESFIFMLSLLDSANSNIVTKKKGVRVLTLVIKECRRIRAWM